MPSIVNATTTAGVAIQGDNSGVLALQTNNGTTAVTINTSQNVGIGTATITSGTGWTPTLVLSATSAALVVKGVNGQECNFGVTNSLYIDSLGNSTATNNNIIFRNTNVNSSFSALERMRIDASGNVGIGTSSPFGTAANRTVLSINGTTDANLTMGSNGSQRSYFVVSSSSVDLSTVGAIPLTFGTNASERMRINSDGNISVNSTSNSVSRFAVNQTATGERCIAAVTPVSYGSACFRSLSGATAGTGWYHLFGTSSSDSVSDIVIYGNGNVNNANGVYGSISDIKLKENITDATPKLDKLMQVKVRNYNFKGSYEQHKQLGVIAQELETVFPGLIEETQDRGENDELLETTTKSVKYSVFVPMLIKAIQELNAKVEAQAAEIAALKGVK